MQKSVSDLSTKSSKMWAWLTRKSNSYSIEQNDGKSQFKKDFQDLHLEIGFLRIKDILQFSFRLSKQRLYQIFNAQTLKPFLEKLLDDPENTGSNYKSIHDFRTTEIARLYFEVASEYLQNATNSEMIKDDLNRVSEHFKIQSGNELKNETYSEHGNLKNKALTRKEETLLENELGCLIQKYYALNKDSNIIKLTNEYRRSTIEYDKLKSKLSHSKISKNKITSLQIKLKGIETINKKYYIKLREVEHELVDEINEITLKLERKYNHLTGVYCQKKFLPSFLQHMIENKMTIPEPNDGTQLVIEPATKEYDSFSIPVDQRPENGNFTNEQRKYYTSSDYFFEILKNHDIVKWYGDIPSVKISELRKYPPFNRLESSVLYSIIPTTGQPKTINEKSDAVNSKNSKKDIQNSSLYVDEIDKHISEKLDIE